jgi:competence protein ComEA
MSGPFVKGTLSMSTTRIHRFLARPLAALTLALFLPSIIASASAHAEGAPPEGVVNINTARAEELMFLPRIGEEKARRIIEQRTKSPFKTVNDLARVKGIGLRTLRLLKPWVRIDGPTTLTSEVKPTDRDDAGEGTPAVPTRQAPRAPTGVSPGR